VKVGRRAWTGAGSVITKDVPDGALAVERAEQRNVAGYDRRKRAKQARQAEGKGETASKKKGSQGRSAGGGATS
jgi:bifunctional UDP-N-acetylglucosamine pyrophosphorylase/glucosamine-1-phosphate N-acetyltransferase